MFYVNVSGKVLKNEAEILSYSPYRNSLRPRQHEEWGK